MMSIFQFIHKKQLILATTAITFVLLFFTACEGSSFIYTSVGTKTTLEIKDASDGSASEMEPVNIGKNRKITIESQLEKGSVKIDFAEATIFRDADPDSTIPDDVIVGDVIESITIAPGDQTEVKLAPGDYVPQVTAVGDTAGKILMNIEKVTP